MYVYLVNDANGPREYVSLLPPDRVGAAGLPAIAILGRLRRRLDEGGDVTPDNLDENPAMVEYLHAFIARTTPTLEGLRAAARAAQAKGDRWLDYVDGRTSRRADAASEDVLGRFEIEDGRVVRWHRNPAHRILTEAGLFQLDPETQAMYLDTLATQSR